jgi:hypothetical protein
LIKGLLGILQEQVDYCIYTVTLPHAMQITLKQLCYAVHLLYNYRPPCGTIRINKEYMSIKVNGIGSAYMVSNVELLHCIYGIECRIITLYIWYRM